MVCKVFMKINQFEEIESWKLARNLATEIYALFRDSRDFSFRDQITRATISISNNIAEWFERQSNTEFRKFLYIAKGSSSEVRSMLYIARDLWYCDDEKFQELFELTLSISKLLSKLIGYLQDHLEK
jgi:four helix bundle protein